MSIFKKLKKEKSQLITAQTQNDTIPEILALAMPTQNVLPNNNHIIINFSNEQNENDNADNADNLINVECKDIEDVIVSDAEVVFPTFSNAQLNTDLNNQNIMDIEVVYPTFKMYYAHVFLKKIV